jgi:hypothetical protein
LRDLPAGYFRERIGSIQLKKFAWSSIIDVLREWSIVYWQSKNTSLFRQTNLPGRF